MATKNYKTNADLYLFKLSGNKPKQMNKSAQNAVIGKNTKAEGEIVYFLPKDKDGKLTGAPVKYLKLTKGGVATGDYVLGNVTLIPEAEFKTSFTALDDINKQMGEFGADGVLDVSNMDALDESFNNFTNESLLDGLTENTSLLNATGNPVKPVNDYKAIKPKFKTSNDTFSNLTNESLVDKFGTITNRSLITENSNFTNESLLDGLTENTSLLNADGDYSNSVGDWWKKTFGKDKKPKATEKLADPNVAIVDEKTMTEAYKESGSKRSFGEWINTEGGKGVMNSITQFANLFINKPYSGGGIGVGDAGGYYGGDNTPPPPSETKIMGMSPLTFGIVAVGLIAVASVFALRMSSGGAKVKIAGA